MRSIKQIEEDLRAARERCAAIQTELDAAVLAEFLQKHGVPDGAKPIFRNRKGEKVLVDVIRYSGPEGRLIKKDGVLSDVRRTLYRGDEYEFVGE